eukprot:scaffold7496_cov444-Prasinococcus_capsulatus_cf.AAC.1
MRSTVSGWAGLLAAVAPLFKPEVVQAVPPPNDLCANAAPLLIDTPNDGDTIDATQTLTYNVCPYDVFRDVWYSFVAPGDGVLTLSTCDPPPGGIVFDTKLVVFSDCEQSASSHVACNDDACPGFRSRVEFDVTGGNTYYVAVTGVLGGYGSFRLLATYVRSAPPPPPPPPPPPNDVCSGAVPLSLDTSMEGSFAATASTISPGTCGNVGRDIWYSIDATTTRNGDIVVVNTEPLSGSSGPDTKLYVYSSCGGSLLACDEGIGGSSQVSFTASASEQYYVAVAASDSEADGDFRVSARSYNPWSCRQPIKLHLP